MKQSTLTMIKIVESTELCNFSKSQKTFQKLIKEIEIKRQILASWETVITQHRHKHASQFNRLLKTFNELRAKVVKLFDEAYCDKSVTKVEQRKLKKAICSIACEILSSQDNETVKEMYNRYSDIDYDTEILEKKEDLQWMMEDIFGIPFDEDMGDSPEEWMARMQEKMQANQAQEKQKKTSQKKSAKALAKEAKEKEAEIHISHSIRDVYRQLARALHPDKEQDAQERDRKTILMQRVNAAYTKKDLLSLLELQLEVEQIDQSMIQDFSEERLKHFNKILRDQCSELQEEIADKEGSFKQSLNIPLNKALSPAAVLTSFSKDIKKIETAISAIKDDLRLFKTVKNIKEWLKYCNG